MWSLKATLAGASYRLYMIAVILIFGIPSSATANELEGPEWQLTRLHGAAVAPLAGGRQPSLKLDATHKKASGFSGCNNYFSQYELDNKNLKFGPVGATRRACPDAESVIEREFLNVLEQTRSWKITDGKLTLYNGAGELASFTIQNESGAQADLDSIVVQSSVYTKGPVRLRQGEYRTPAAPGSAGKVVVKLTEKRAFGNMQGRALGAVVLVTSTDGTGTFYELALVEKRETGWVNTDTVLLGDRVKVRSVMFKADRFVVKMQTHASSDPLCCPSLEVTKEFTVENGHLRPVETGTADGAQLIGTRWQWVQTRYNNDKLVAPPNPGKYTLQLAADGHFNVKADCNLKSGTYTTKGKQLSLTILNSTMAACEPGSLEEEYVRNLSAAVNYFFRNGKLYLDLKYDTGTMTFGKQTE